jgi:hypothetical protein
MTELEEAKKRETLPYNMFVLPMAAGTVAVYQTQLE